MNPFEALVREFSRARSAAMREAVYAGVEVPPETCRYCGRYWKQWPGSKLDGHSKCVITDDFKHLVRDFVNRPEITYAMVGAALGVSPSVVRSWTFPIRSAA